MAIRMEQRNICRVSTRRTTQIDDIELNNADFKRHAAYVKNGSIG